MSDFQQGVLLGKIRETQLQTLYEVREIKRAMKDKEPVPRVESWIKSFLSIAAPTATLWATGSVTKAIEVLQIVAGR
jgi:hypothetical protein